MHAAPHGALQAWRAVVAAALPWWAVGALVITIIITTGCRAACEALRLLLVAACKAAHAVPKACLSLSEPAAQQPCHVT